LNWRIKLYNVLFGDNADRQKTREKHHEVIHIRVDQMTDFIKDNPGITGDELIERKIPIIRTAAKSSFARSKYYSRPDMCYDIKGGFFACEKIPKKVIENEWGLKNNEGYIYFIRYNEQPWYIKDHTKIGRAKAPEDRLSACNTWTSSIGGCYMYIKIQCEDYIHEEKIIHRYLNDMQFIKKNGKKTEWFLLTTPMIDDICDMLTKGRSNPTD
jgi:hypothetical protein